MNEETNEQNEQTMDEIELLVFDAPDEQLGNRESNPTVDDICRRYEECIRRVSVQYPDNPSECYDIGLTSLKGLEYTAQDVAAFSLRLKQYEENSRYTGFFLSALMNTCPDKEFEIFTEHLETPIDSIGYKNTKQVTVNGDAGNNVGGSMGGGSITINGDVGYSVGIYMKGGSIIVNGNAGGGLGNGHGGIVRIEGEMGFISGLWKRGEIYHKGERVRRSRRITVYDGRW